ncbi:MAG: hypothetical protein ACLQUY_23070 [Ktedonobacterales bacterium]
MSEESAASELEQLTALAISLLASPIDPNSPQPHLFPSTIPENIPLEIPVPPHTRVLGTLARSDSSFVITLESDLPLDEMISVHRAQLTALAWNEFEYMRQPPTGGFVQSDYRPSARLAFCHTPSHACLRPMLVQRENATTHVRLDLTLGEEGNPCARQDQPAPRGFPRYPNTGRQMLPTLIAPLGAQLGGTSSHGDPEWMHTTSTVTTPLDQEALAHHYVGQLTQAGWTQTDAGAGGPFVWSTWHLTSTGPEPTPWSALFFILKTPDKPDDYTLDLRAFRLKSETTE